MKKFCIWHGDGSKEIVEGKSATFKRTKDGLKIRIDSRVIKNAVGLTEVCESIKEK